MKLSAKIKREYKDIRPKKAIEPHGPHDYCVGGLLCKYFFDVVVPQTFIELSHFPTSSRVLFVLLQLNNNLTPRRALNYANSIIQANDQGHFEEAWNLIDEALEQQG